MKNNSNKGIQNNKHYLSRSVRWIVFIFIVGIGGYLALPSNYYLRRALTHLLPKIDQYPIFENRVVQAGSPRPWELSEAYNTKSIPERYLPRFEELGTVAYVIIQDNRLLFEQYWEDYSPESHSNSFSMAKSIVSLAIGCAIDDGFIRNVDQPVSDFFPEFKGYDGKALTLRHLLTMSAGVDFDEAYSSPFSPTTQLYYGDDLQEIAFGMKEIDEPGVNFIYQSGVTQLLGFIVEKATGEKLSDYVSRKLWTPMHAEESALWSLDRKDGMEKAYCCFNSNARDFARFGQLLLNNGQWDGQQLISLAYLAEATSPDTRLVYKDLGKPNHWLRIPILDSRLQRDEDPLYERNLGAIRLHAPGKERRDRKTRAQTQRYLYRRPTLSGRYKYMVGRGDGLTSIRIYLSNDLKINAHEKNDFNDSAIGGTPIAFLRTETQYAKAGHHVYAATTVQSADVCLLQGPRSYQDRRKAFSRGMGRDTLDQRLRGYRRRQTPGPSLPDPGQDDLR